MSLCSNTMLSIERQLLDTDNYIQMYLPLQSLNQIDGTLSYVFGSSSSAMEKLIKYHKLKYKELEDKIKAVGTHQVFNKKYYYMPIWEQREFDLQMKIS